LTKKTRQISRIRQIAATTPEVQTVGDNHPLIDHGSDQFSLFDISTCVLTVFTEQDPLRAVVTNMFGAEMPIVPGFLDSPLTCPRTRACSFSAKFSSETKHYIAPGFAAIKQPPVILQPNTSSSRSRSRSRRRAVALSSKDKERMRVLENEEAQREYDWNVAERIRDDAEDERQTQFDATLESTRRRYSASLRAYADQFNSFLAIWKQGEERRSRECEMSRALVSSQFKQFISRIERRHNLLNDLEDGHNDGMKEGFIVLVERQTEILSRKRNEWRRKASAAQAQRECEVMDLLRSLGYYREPLVLNPPNSFIYPPIPSPVIAPSPGVIQPPMQVMPFPFAPATVVLSSILF
jgi:uncharacterized protein (UPF0335 family)